MALAVDSGARAQQGAQLLHHRLRDVVLHREDVVELAVIRFRPQVRIGRDLDHCAVMRTRVPDLRTLPWMTAATLSFCATDARSTFLPLK
jgi:hypothetical protein